MNKKVLIFGIDSFTGKYLESLLKKSSYDVYGTSLKNKSEKTYICDIKKKDQILNILEKVKADYIINFAGISFPGHKNLEDFYNVNVIGTTNILDCILELKTKPKKIIIVSSAVIYGNQNLEVLDESLCANPNNHYAASKYSMECMVKNYFNKLNIIITRPFNYTGKSQENIFLIPKIVSHFKNKQKEIELGNLDVKREFNDISFVCDVYKKLLENETKSEIVNISSNRLIKLLDVIKIMNKIAGYEIKILVNPLFVRKNEIKSLSGACDKLFSIIGKTEQIAFEKTLKNMYES